ncbi:hypothetical protein [uncultured Roseibium sp.]|uniref:hypothetical protein n=1 Tax=uncultured Roseibium sp. TaxID=1936171 RepID=UPI002636D7F2|nr:hypothetical protein [uncultured Roseibium sp.]
MGIEFVGSEDTAENGIKLIIGIDGEENAATLTVDLVDLVEALGNQSDFETYNQQQNRIEGKYHKREALPIAYKVGLPDPIQTIGTRMFQLQELSDGLRAVIKRIEKELPKFEQRLEEREREKDASFVWPKLPRPE